MSGAEETNFICLFAIEVRGRRKRIALCVVWGFKTMQSHPSIFIFQNAYTHSVCQIAAAVSLLSEEPHGFHSPCSITVSYLDYSHSCSLGPLLPESSLLLSFSTLRSQCCFFQEASTAFQDRIRRPSSCFVALFL